MKLLANAALVVALLGALSACASAPAVLQAALGGAAAIRTAYCLGISDAGKRATRDVVSNGEPIVLCPAPEA